MQGNTRNWHGGGAGVRCQGAVNRMAVVQSQIHVFVFKETLADMARKDNQT